MSPMLTVMGGRSMGRAAKGASAASASAALTGTLTSAVESDVVAGGKTLVLTLTNETWVAAGGTFDAQRQNILNGIDSGQAEAHGWDVERANLAVTTVVRTSATVVTITLGALAAYAVTASETLTVTIPGTALTGGNAVVATPTVTLTNESGSGEPTPSDVGATILYDIRSSLEAATTRTDLIALIQDFDSGLTSADFDLYADGTHKWMRYNYPTGGPGSTEVAFAGVVPWSGTNSGFNNFCVSWIEQWGKMAGDTGAVGTTDVLDFRTDYGNAHLKSILILRGTSGISNDRRIYVKCFPADISAQIDGNNYSGDGWGYDVFDGQGTPVRWTLRVTSSSADNTDQASGPADGSLEVWRNGTLVLTSTGQRIGRGAPWGLNTLATFISTNGPTTAYQRAIAVWGI